MQAQEAAEDPRQRRKLDIRLDVNTLDIRDTEVTPNSVGDAQVLPSLLSQIDPHEALLSVGGAVPTTPMPVTR